MKKFIIKTIGVGLVAAGALALVPAAQADAASGTKFCGGQGLDRVWVGKHTSCGMGKATQRVYANACASDGECNSSVVVRSPATSKRYRMFRVDSNGHGGVFEGQGAKGSIVHVEFWTP